LLTISCIIAHKCFHKIRKPPNPFYNLKNFIRKIFEQGKPLGCFELLYTLIQNLVLSFESGCLIRYLILKFPSLNFLSFILLPLMSSSFLIIQFKTVRFKFSKNFPRKSKNIPPATQNSSTQRSRNTNATSAQHAKDSKTQPVHPRPRYNKKKGNENNLNIVF
jgi:hypothetical protein